VLQGVELARVHQQLQGVSIIRPTLHTHLLRALSTEPLAPLPAPALAPALVPLPLCPLSAPPWSSCTAVDLVPLCLLMPPPPPALGALPCVPPPSLPQSLVLVLLSAHLDGVQVPDWVHAVIYTCPFACPSAPSVPVPLTAPMPLLWPLSAPPPGPRPCSCSQPPRPTPVLLSAHLDGVQVHVPTDVPAPAPPPPRAAVSAPGWCPGP
jgi:hypothetical protein